MKTSGNDPAERRESAGQAVGDQAGREGGAGGGDAVDTPPTATPTTLVLSIVLYTLARFALVAVVAALIMGIGSLAGVTVPLFVAAVFGVLIALPLGMILFKSLRRRVNTQIATIEADRRQRQEDLQSRLRGGR